MSSLSFNFLTRRCLAVVPSAFVGRSNAPRLTTKATWVGHPFCLADFIATELVWEEIEVTDTDEPVAAPAAAHVVGVASANMTAASASGPVGGTSADRPKSKQASLMNFFKK